MALLTHQKISYVLPGKPFGRGTLGTYSSATAPTMTKDSCSGTATSTTLTTSGSTFSNGDLLFIHQTRGTGVGQWEIGLVSSGGGTTSLTLSNALVYTYTDSGASQAQVIKINEYNTVTAESGTWNAPAWDKNTGGILIFSCKNLFTPTGTISASSKGYLPTGDGNDNFGRGDSGESSTADGSDGTNSANGTGGGGGGGGTRETPGGGAGGGHATSGTNGSGSGPGVGGGTDGGANLDDLVLGGAGGSGGGGHSTPATGQGGIGGGAIIIFAKEISSPTLISAAGGNGGAGTAGSPNNQGDGGGGAGGSILICSQVVNIGTDKLTTAGGVTGVSVGPDGGAGGKGRIAVYYGNSLTGSVSSTYYGSLTTEQDSSLIDIIDSSFPIFFGNTAIA